MSNFCLFNEITFDLILKAGPKFWPGSKQILAFHLLAWLVCQRDGWGVLLRLQFQ